MLSLLPDWTSVIHFCIDYRNKLSDLSFYEGVIIKLVLLCFSRFNSIPFLSINFAIFNFELNWPWHCYFTFCNTYVFVLKLKIYPINNPPNFFPLKGNNIFSWPKDDTYSLQDVQALAPIRFLLRVIEKQVASFVSSSHFPLFNLNCRSLFLFYRWKSKHTLITELPFVCSKHSIEVVNNSAHCS